MSDASSCSSPMCDAVGLLITVLQLGQFLPQHFEMASEKTTVGVSAWLLFFGGLYSYLAAVDIMISSHQLFVCQGSAYRCFIDSQPLVQMIGSALLSATMWYWYLKYAHTEDDEELDEDELLLEQNPFYAPFSGRKFFTLFIAISVLVAIAAGWVVSIHGVDSEEAKSFAQTCGLSSALLNAIMWLPQIYVTWTFKHKGALAIGWVLSSIVMDVVYSTYLSILGVNFSVWANNIPDAVQTSLLLAMVLYFEHEDSLAGRDNFGHVVLYGEDTQPLVSRKSSTLHEALQPYGSLNAA